MYLFFSFVTCVFGVSSKKPLLNPGLKKFTPIFYSKSCTLLILFKIKIEERRISLKEKEEKY